MNKRYDKLMLLSTVFGFGLWVAVLSYKFTGFFRLLTNGNSLRSSIGIFDILGFLGLLIGITSFTILGFKKTKKNSKDI